MLPKGGMSGMLKQAQKMQEKMVKVQEELSLLKVEGQSGGGMVTVVANGKKELLSVKIEAEILKEDVEMVEDLFLSAANQALNNATEAAEGKMTSITGGMKIPGL